MSEGLSREEFLILQEQLIELRNKNYELHEEVKKKSALLEGQNSGPKNEALQFASKLINRSKDKDVLKLETELATLRRKLDSQEDEFRLQQQTLIQEMNEFSSKNQQLQSEIEELREGSGVSTELTSLKNENAELIMKVEQLTEQVVSQSEVQTSLRNTEKELQLTIESREGMIVALENQMLDYTAKLENKIQAETELQQKIEELEGKLLSLQGKSEDDARLIDELHSMLHENQEVKQRLKGTVAELQDLRADLAKKQEELRVARSQIDNLQSTTEAVQAELLKSQQGVGELREKLQSAVLETEMELQKRSEAERRLHENAAQHEREKKEMEDALTGRFSEEATTYRREINQLETKLQEASSADAKRHEDELLIVENRYQMKLNSMEKQFLTEKDALLQKIAKLEETLDGKDDEKNIALKKQAALVKELQRAVKEERKRAESEERSREKEGWHMVESDQRSSNTYDGNDSVSSLSVLETDNAELISRLTTMQRLYADTVDRLSHVENESARLNREVHEKNELIEHWIRCRPLTSIGSSNSNTQSPRQEGVFRKFLSSTLSTEDANSDIREMNKKLQRMLEETLSKNIILQRDLQTLLERTEM